LATWLPDGEELAIEYDRSVFEEIRVLVVNGFKKVSHGGLEVGGVLFGERDGAVIRIRGFRELRIEYKSGPSFTLSDKDELELRELLRASRADPDLSGLEPLGWWHSHTRSEIHLSAGDIALHDRYFPEPWQVALVLKPHKWDPVRAAFFLRHTDGAMAEAPASPEFELAPPKRPLQNDSATAQEPAPAQVVSAPVGQPAVILTRWTSRWPALLGLAALLAAAAAVISVLEMRRESAPFQVRLADSNGQLTISWDRTAQAVQQARSATLEIGDGNEAISVPLTPDQVRRGNVTYMRNSRAVTVRLRVHPESGPPVDDLASFVGSLVQRLPAHAPGKPQEIADQPDTSPPPAKEAAREKDEQDAPPEVVVIRPKRFLAPRTALRRGVEEPILAEAPQISGVESRGVPFSAAPVPRLPAPAPAAEAPPQRRSGRIIWTGQLRRREYLAIDGNHSSTGFLNGELPLVPVKIRVYPVDLTETGLRIYTVDAALNGKVEPPGPQNGWNPTRFTVDPRTAASLRVVEAPGQQNGWKRVVLQSVGRDESAVVIQWETM
jgi:proteasome lid subunit RPN8/RPN11